MPLADAEYPQPPASHARRTLPRTSLSDLATLNTQTEAGRDGSIESYPFKPPLPSATTEKLRLKQSDPPASTQGMSELLHRDQPPANFTPRPVRGASSPLTTFSRPTLVVDSRQNQTPPLINPVAMRLGVRQRVKTMYIHTGPPSSGQSKSRGVGEMVVPSEVPHPVSSAIRPLPVAGNSATSSTSAPYKHSYEIGFGDVIPKIVPPMHNSDNRTVETGHQRGIWNAVLCEPPSHVTPSSPCYSTSSEPFPRGIPSPVDGGSAESTLMGQQTYPWMGEFAGNDVVQISSESTVTPTRRERPNIKPLPQRPVQAPIHQAHQYVAPEPLPLPPYPLPSSDVPPITTPATASVSASHTQLPLPKPVPQPPALASFFAPGPLRSIPSDDDSDGGSNEGGTLWAISDNTGSTVGKWPKIPQSDRRKSLPRLFLDPPQVQAHKPSGSTTLPQVPQFMPLEYPPTNRRPPKPQTKPLNSLRTSAFDEDFRPPAEEMYERLGDFFPGHDLDDPVIEASSCGTSPTFAEVAQPFPTPSGRKRKKSIRVVANEHKRRLDRTSSRVSSANDANMLRKRSTKLWGNKVEEVTADRINNLSSALSTPPESPSEPKRAFQKGVPGYLD